MEDAVPSAAPPITPQILAMLEAMLGDDPLPAELIARMADPETVANRAKLTADLMAADWPNLGRYEADNAALIASGERPDIVFMGDSITEIWPIADPGLFPPGRVGRGISGQTTPQMLTRFHADVIALKPRAVHLMGGVNDIAGNTGPTTPDRYKGHILAMTDLAAAHGLRVIIGSLTPAAAFQWNPAAKVGAYVYDLNAWLKALAAERGFAFADYHTPLADSAGALPAQYGKDGVHPNRRGYAVMRKVLEPLL